ncbi:MAG: membrane protein insertase YidC [Candidatus Taylorbacteria bacterium]|nr:membrane protein insertase YidC [Candidatus Taylorbacteria bacterium]
MISAAFSAIFYRPLYNGLVFLLSVFPFLDAGLAIIIFTIIIKFALFPLSKKSIKTQLVMKSVQPEVDKIKEKHKNDRERQARELLNFYRGNDINPFSGFFLILIQFPILLALYWVFYKGGLDPINTGLLYSFVMPPVDFDHSFLSIWNISERSVPLALTAAAVQYLQIKFSMPIGSTPAGEKSFGADLAKMMQLQMKYVFPVIIYFIAHTSGGLALYLITSSLFAVGQELYMRKNLKSGKTSNPLVVNQVK